MGKQDENRVYMLSSAEYTKKTMVVWITYFLLGFRCHNLCFVLRL